MKHVLVDRETPLLLPCDLREWVAEDDLVHFVLEAVRTMDLKGFAVNERGTGSAQYPPGMLLALLIYCYAMGTFSSRKIERLTHQHLSVRYLCGNTHPDHDTIASFRARHAALFCERFTEVLRLARALKLVHLGTVHVDGTKILADASKRATHDLAGVEEQLELADRRLAEGLLEQAAQADESDDDRAYRLPRELARTAQLRAQLQAAREQLAARATPRTRPTANLTDPDSRLMPASQGSGYVQAYNAQLAVDAQGLIVGQTVSQATNDRAELLPTAATIPAAKGEIEHLVADTGYDNQAQITALETQLDTTVICAPQAAKPAKPGARSGPAQRQALARERQRRARWAHRPFGRQLLQQRQTTIEPVFGYLKHVLGFRRFSLRGLTKVRGEWSLLTLALNCRKLWRRLLARA